ncbi:MAG: dienelactone hydrolase family protein [Desulfobacterales bacterium]|nr:dienelactone hydrolase family protein [Desulfobacterales bacterium]
MKIQDLSIPLNTGDRISAVLTTPEDPATTNAKGIVIAHGAANDMNNDLIRAVAQGLSEQGFACLRFNFLYRERGKKSVDPEHRLVHAWQEAVACLYNHTDCTAYIAMGKSLGARIAAQATAAGDLTPDSLIYLGYPLHAPGKKDKLRDAPLRQINRPMLFFEGTRDPFCDLDKLDTVFSSLPNRPDLTIIDKGNHSFDLPKSDGRPMADIYRAIVDRCTDWITP